MYGNHNTKARGGKMVKYFCKVKTTNVNTEATTKEKPKLSYPEKKEQMYQVSDFTLQIQDDKNSMVLAQP